MHPVDAKVCFRVRPVGDLCLRVGCTGRFMMSKVITVAGVLAICFLGVGALAGPLDAEAPSYSTAPVFTFDCSVSSSLPDGAVSQFTDAVCAKLEDEVRREVSDRPDWAFDAPEGTLSETPLAVTVAVTVDRPDSASAKLRWVRSESSCMAELQASGGRKAPNARSVLLSVDVSDANLGSEQADHLARDLVSIAKIPAV